MKSLELPWWLSLVGPVTFREGEDDDNAGDGGSDDDGDDQDDDEGQDEDDKDDDGDDDESDKEKLKLALREERRLRRKAEREARKASKKKSTDREEKDLEQTRKALEAQIATNERLATRLRTSSLDSAILEEARRQGFIDPTDALRPDVRDDIDIEQDEDDPSKVEIDADTVKDAVADLASRKKHLVRSADDKKSPPGNDGQPSGGKFKKKGKKDEGSADEAALAANYPALR